MPRAKTKPNDIMQSNRDAPQGNAAARKQKRRIPPFGRCAHPGCKPNRAIGATGMCKSHGGGKRCLLASKRIRAVDNARAAQPSFAVFTAAESGACLQASARGLHIRYCVGHGGGKRCAHKGCGQSARGAAEYCSVHGGGKRCAKKGCPNGAERATDFCKGHGGGKRCAHKGCIYSAEGATEYCVGHGGGLRCPNCAT